MATTKKTAETTDSKEKKDPFKEALKGMEEKYGTGVIVGETADALEIVSTGSIMLNIATGIGGYPIGKVIEIYGVESSGKSTITLHAIAEYQKKYPNDEVVLIDKEYSYDKQYAAAIGVNTKKLVILQPDSQEDMYNIIETLVKTGRVRLVVIDSTSAALPKGIIDGEIGKQLPGSSGRNNSTGLGKLKGELAKHKCTLIGISQLRADIGGYGGQKPNSGNAWKFYSDMRMSVQKEVKTDEDLNKTTVTVVKNKCSAPYGKAIFEIAWAKGIDRQKEIIDCAAEFKLIKKAGSWFTIGDKENEIKMQGEEALREFMNNNEEWSLDLECKVIEKLKSVM